MKSDLYEQVDKAVRIDITYPGTDIAAVLLRLPDGTTAQHHLSWGQEHQFTAHVLISGWKSVKTEYPHTFERCNEGETLA